MTENRNNYPTLLNSKALEVFERLEGKNRRAARLSFPIESYGIFRDQMAKLTGSIRTHFNDVNSSGIFPEHMLPDINKTIIAILYHLYASYRDFSFLNDSKFPVQILKRFHDHLGKNIQIIEGPIFPYYVPAARTRPAYSLNLTRQDIIPSQKNAAINIEKLVAEFPRLYRIGIPTVNFTCYPSLVTLYHEYAHIIVGRITYTPANSDNGDSSNDEIPDSFKEILEIGEREFDQVKSELYDQYVHQVLQPGAKEQSAIKVIKSLFDKWTDEILSDYLAYYLIGPSLFFSFYCNSMHQNRDIWDIKLVNNIESAHPSMAFRLFMLRELFYKKKEWERDFADLIGIDAQWAQCIIGLPEFLSSDFVEWKGNVIVDPKSFGSNDDLSKLLTKKLPDIITAIKSFTEKTFDHVQSFVTDWREDVFTDINYPKVCSLLKDLIAFLKSAKKDQLPPSRHENDLQSLMLATCLGYFCILNNGSDRPGLGQGSLHWTVDQKLKLLNTWTQSKL